MTSLIEIYRRFPTREAACTWSKSDGKLLSGLVPDGTRLTNLRPQPR